MNDYTAAIIAAKLLLRIEDGDSDNLLSTLAEVAANEAYRRTQNKKVHNDTYLIASMIRTHYQLLDIGVLKSQSIGPTISETYNIEYPDTIEATLLTYRKINSL